MATRARYTHGVLESYESTTGEVVRRDTAVQLREECYGIAPQAFASVNGFSAILPGTLDAVVYQLDSGVHGSVEMQAGTALDDTVHISVTPSTSAHFSPTIQAVLSPMGSGDSLTNTGFGIGFCTSNGLTESGQFKQSGTTWTVQGTDAVGIHYDSAATAKTFWSMACNTNVNATPQNSGIAPENGQWYVLRVDLRLIGATIRAHCFIGGTEVARFNSAINPELEYYPFVSCRRSSIEGSAIIAVDTLAYWGNRS